MIIYSLRRTLLVVAHISAITSSLFSPRILEFARRSRAGHGPVIQPPKPKPLA